MVVALAVKLAVAQVAHVAQVAQAAQVARVPKKRNLRFVQPMAAEEPVVALAALAAELSAELASARLEPFRHIQTDFSSGNEEATQLQLVFAIP